MSRFLGDHKLPFRWINAASHSNYMFNFKRNSQNVFQSGCTILRSNQQYMSDPVSVLPFSPGFGIVTMFYWRYSDKCVVPSHCGTCIFVITRSKTSLVAQMVKYLFTMWETRVRSLGWEDPLEKEVAIHSRTTAWKIPWTRTLVGYSPRGRKESDTTEQLHSIHYNN